MFESIIYAFALIFILCGMFFVCLLIFDKIITPRECEHFFMLVPGFHGDEYLPSTVYSAFIRANILTFSKRNKVIVLDMGLDDSEKQECKKMLEGFGSVFFCKDKEITELFVERSERK